MSRADPVDQIRDLIDEGGPDILSRIADLLLGPQEVVRNTPVFPTFQHPDDAAVDRFAAAMKSKMASSRAKGRNGWDNEVLCSTARLQTMLVEHLSKGDPVDIGNFAMMLWNRGEPVADVGMAFRNGGDEPDWVAYAEAESAAAPAGDAQQEGGDGDEQSDSAATANADDLLAALRSFGITYDDEIPYNSGWFTKGSCMARATAQEAAQVALEMIEERYGILQQDYDLVKGYVDRQVPLETSEEQSASDSAPDADKLQFLTDVVTAAGLLSYGRTDKALARRISDGAYEMRAALFANRTADRKSVIIHENSLSEN